MKRSFWRKFAHFLNFVSFGISAVIFSNLLKGREVEPGIQIALSAGSMGVQLMFLAILIMSRNSQ